jgi:hypothetical protein
MPIGNFAPPTTTPDFLHEPEVNWKVRTIDSKLGSLSAGLNNRAEKA